MVKFQIQHEVKPSAVSGIRSCLECCMPYNWQNPHYLFYCDYGELSGWIKGTACALFSVMTCMMNKAWTIIIVLSVSA